MLPELSFYSPAPNRNSETEFGAKEEKNSFIAMPGKGGHVELMLSKLCALTWGGGRKCFKVKERVFGKVEGASRACIS